VHEQTYWTPTLATDAALDPAEFRARFEKSVERRLVADVPRPTAEEWPGSPVAVSSSHSTPFSPTASRRNPGPSPQINASP